MKSIFEPFSIGTLTFKNRIIRSATHEGMARADGMPTDDLAKTYRRLAEGGAGAIITGYMGVCQGGKSFPNMCMLDDDAYIPVYKSINDQLKPYHTPLILQIAHSGSRSISKVTGRPVVGASPRRKNEFGDRVEEASDAEVGSIIEAFVAAIVRAKTAGFNAVELHAAHGYLLSEFISPVLNRRRDRWGGSTENRVRIVTEILAAARRKIGRFPILVKISAQDEFKRGMSETEAITIAQMLQASSCDALEVSCGCGDFMHTIRMPKLPVDAVLALMPGYREMSRLQKGLMRLVAPFIAKVHKPLYNYNVPIVEAIRRNVDIPVIAVGGIRTFSDINSIICEKRIDAVSLCRPFIIEPDIVNRFQRGQERSRCINCGYCIIGVTANKLRCYYGRIPLLLKQQR